MILIGTDEGIYRWFDGSGWPVFHSLQDRAVVGLASPGAGVLAAVDSAGGVVESTDNGLTWRALPLPEGVHRPTAVAVEGVPASVVIAVKPLGLFRRAVGAPVLKGKSAPLPGSGLAPRLLHRARDLAGGATALLPSRRARVEPDESTVKLAGWAPLGSPSPPRSYVSPHVRTLTVAPGVWYASVSGAGVWRSGDLGRSWSQCHGLPSEVYALRAVAGRAGHVWAATDDGCWRSTDAGTTWEDRSAGLEAVRHARAVEVKPGEPDVLLAGVAPRSSNGTASPATRPGLNFALYESTNGGKSWTPVRKNFPDVLESDTITDIRYDPSAPDNVIVALGSGELWVTRNSGAYWGPLARQIKAARVLCAIG